MQLVTNDDLFYFQFYKKFEKEPQKLGSSKDWNVDLIPKFIMARGMKYMYTHLVVQCRLVVYHGMSDKSLVFSQYTQAFKRACIPRTCQ